MIFPPNTPMIGIRPLEKKVIVDEKKEKDTVISPKNYGIFLQKRRRR